MDFIWPAPGPITRDFYYRSSVYVGGQHAAIDVAAPTGTPIRAVAAGVVVGVGWDSYSGFFVAINHFDGWRSTYRHLYGQAPVAVRDHVSQWRIIGNVGNTGYSLGPHLHFDLWNRNKVWDGAFYKNGWYAIDPELYLGKEDNVSVLEEHQKILDNLWARMAGAEQAIKTLQKEIVDLRARTTGGGVSEARVKELIRAAGHMVR